MDYWRAGGLEGAIVYPLSAARAVRHAGCGRLRLSRTLRIHHGGRGLRTAATERKRGGSRGHLTDGLSE